MELVLPNVYSENQLQSLYEQDSHAVLNVNCFQSYTHTTYKLSVGKSRLVSEKIWWFKSAFTAQVALQMGYQANVVATKIIILYNHAPPLYKLS